MTGVVPLKWPDYLVFAVMLAASAIVGLYHGFVRGGQKTTKEFLLANRQVCSIPAALTILASFVSPVTLLGNPGEVYTYGAEYMAGLLQHTILLPTVCFLLVPVFHGLDITTAYEYFQKRFGLSMRLFGAFIFLIQTLFYVAIVTFTPAIAINAVTNFPIWQLILITGLVCTFYTTLGGLSAVIWTDSFMAIIILAVMTSCIIMGSDAVGGFAYAWEVNVDAGRTDLFQFPLDLTERLTFPSLFVGSYFSGLTLFGISNTAVQRFLAARSLRDAQISVLLNIPMVVGLIVLCCFQGIVMYAFYNSPDNSGVMRSPPNITASDQIFIYFVSEQFGNIPCFQGIFISCLVAGALSTISSGLNAMSAVTLVDIIKPYREWREQTTKVKRNVSDARDTNISKILITVFGLVAMVIAFLCLSLGTLFSLFNTLFGATGGPLLACFTMGMLWKRANEPGVLVGASAGVAVGFLLVIGSFATTDRDDKAYLYQISFMWYAFATFSTTMLVGVPLSEFFRWLEPDKHAKDVNQVYLATILRPKGFRQGDYYGDDKVQLCKYTIHEEVMSATNSKDLELNSFDHQD